MNRSENVSSVLIRDGVPRKRGVAKEITENLVTLI
jgi:hypothetical protein